MPELSYEAQGIVGFAVWLGGIAVCWLIIKLEANKH